MQFQAPQSKNDSATSEEATRPLTFPRLEKNVSDGNISVPTSVLSIYPEAIHLNIKAVCLKLYV